MTSEVGQVGAPAGVPGEGVVDLAAGGGAVGCTVTPEFRPEHFEAGLASELAEHYPAWSEGIRRLGLPEGSSRNLPDT